MKIEDRGPLTTATSRPVVTGAGFGLMLGAMDTAAQSGDGRAVGFQDLGMFGRMEPTAAAQRSLPARPGTAAAPPEGEPAVQPDRRAAHPALSQTSDGPATPSRAVAAVPASQAMVQTRPLWTAVDGTQDAVETARSQGTDPADQIETGDMRRRETPIPLRGTKHPNVMAVAPGTTDDSVSLTLFLAGLTAKEQTAFRKRAEALTRDYGVALDKLVFTSEGTSQTGATLKGPTSWR